MLSFLHLPSKIRCIVYSYAVCPGTTPLTYFNGFYNSCRQIKHETDVECAKYLRPYLQKAHHPSAYNAFRFNIPETFMAMRNVHISIATDLERLPVSWYLELLVPLLELHLDSVTITFCKHDGNSDSDANHVYWLDEYLDGTWSTAHAGRVIFNLTLEDGSQVQAWIRPLEHTILKGFRRYYVQKGLVVARHGDCGKCVILGDHAWETALEGRLPTKMEAVLRLS